MDISPFFRPLSLGDLDLANRIVMAPMTRNRVELDGVVNDLAPTYYAQRASAGMIVTESTWMHPMARGNPRGPGIFTDAQVAAWARAVDAVHAKGCKFLLQLTHSGRKTHPSVLPGEALPVAPSAIAAPGEARTVKGPQPHVAPRALETDEIAGIVAQYREGARRAMEAGFDGVEVHGASGFLPEQFLCSNSNRRTDRYGGSVENRVRFTVEVLRGLAEEIGPGRVGIKISPENAHSGVSDETPEATYSGLVKAIAPLGLGYLHVSQQGKRDVDYHGMLRPLFPGRYLAGGGFTAERGAAMLAAGGADAIVFGKLFIANPDLPARFTKGAPLAESVQATVYALGAEGYIDYPALGG